MDEAGAEKKVNTGSTEGMVNRGTTIAEGIKNRAADFVTGESGMNRVAKSQYDAYKKFYDRLDDGPVKDAVGRMNGKAIVLAQAAGVAGRVADVVVPAMLIDKAAKTRQSILKGNQEYAGKQDELKSINQQIDTAKGNNFVERTFQPMDVDPQLIANRDAARAELNNIDKGIPKNDVLQQNVRGVAWFVMRPVSGAMYLAGKVEGAIGTKVADTVNWITKPKG